MQPSIISFLFLLITVHVGHAFTQKSPLRKSRHTQSAIFGKRERAMKKVKRIFKGSDKPVEVEEGKSNFAFDGQKVKLSDGKAKDLARKYEDIDDLEEKTFQVLVDLKMVERS